MHEVIIFTVTCSICTCYIIIIHFDEYYQYILVKFLHMLVYIAIEVYHKYVDIWTFQNYFAIKQDTLILYNITNINNSIMKYFK